MCLCDGVLAGVTTGTVGLLPGLTRGCSSDAVGRAARALGRGLGTPGRRCGPMPSACVGGGHTSAGEHKGMSPAGAPGS